MEALELPLYKVIEDIKTGSISIVDLAAKS